MEQVIKERLEGCGLMYDDEFSLFSYYDRFSKVLYKQVETIGHTEELPVLAIYTSLPDRDNFEYEGLVSLAYHFYGNDVVVASVKNSVEQMTSNAEIIENSILNSKLTMMSSELILRNGSQEINNHDICPLINIMNSYDGSLLLNLGFGLGIFTQGRLISTISFRQTLGTFRQIHIRGSNTQMINIIGETVELISNNLPAIAQQNFDRPIDEQILLSSLDLIESVGKRRRIEIGKTLQEIQQQNHNLTLWDLFLAITKFSCSERNINAKMILENIVERLMVLPTEMLNFLKKAA